jgi:CRP-like cAMP-binding protein
MAESSTRPDTRQRLLVNFKAGDAVFLEGHPGAEMYIIEDGQVEIVRRRADEERRLMVLEPGDFFGEMSLLEDMPRTATARAVTDCRLLPVDASTFDLMLRDHPEVAIRIMRMLSRRLRQFDEAEQRAHAIAAGPLNLSHTTAGPHQAVSVVDVVAEVPAAPEPAAAAEDRFRPSRAWLVHPATGGEIAVALSGEQVIGRLDPVTGLVPEIDLTALDTRRSLSRRHARIAARDGRFFVREEIGVANGTFVSGERLAAGREREIADGDAVRLGLVELRFHLEAGR